MDTPVKGSPELDKCCLKSFITIYRQLWFQADEVFCFIVEWYEELAARTRQFQFFYRPNSKSVEMVSFTLFPFVIWVSQNV